MKIEKHSVVSVNYTLKNDAGEVLDTSDGREPLTYLQGVGAIIPGLESQLVDKVVGDKFTTTVQPQDAYGVRREDLLKVVPKSGSQGDEEMVIGMQVQLETEHGPAIASVSKIEGDDVTLDLNHPLADTVLHFDIEVVEIRKATQEEIDHGHVHGPGGHHH